MLFIIELQNMKYLGMNLTKYMWDHALKNTKHDRVIKDLSSGRNTLFSWIGRFDIFKVSILWY